MLVSKIMQTRVITINLDDTLEHIQKLFEKHKFHHVLVVEEGELLGVISDRDVLKEISPHINALSEDARALTTLRKKAHQIMTRTPITTEKHTRMEDAANLMLNKVISCLPILSESGQIEGILSMKDILKFYIEKNGSADLSVL